MSVSALAAAPEPSKEHAAAPDPVLSVVVPMRNEAANIDAFFHRLLPALDRLSLAYEVVCVDDGSTDATWGSLLVWRAREDAVRLVSLSRNFGKEVALTAGLDAARGEAVVLIDADLQHPPELIETFIAKWRAGYEMVYAQRRDRRTDGVLRRHASRLFYWAFGRMADVEMPDGAGDFRLLDRKVVEALKSMPERARFMKGLYAWVGFRHTGVPFDPEPRHDGRSAFGLGNLFRFAVDGLVSFSTAPLTACAYLGAMIALPAVLMGLYFAFRTLILGVDVPGYASIIVAVMVLGGVQLLSLGVIGAYIGRLYEEAKQRPLYIVRQTEGMDPAIERQARPVLPLRPVHAPAAADPAPARGSVPASTPAE
ncbi:MAG: glycosyltransferase family 2 protein [Alphaproteobacteria bacterium]|nr:glycosyltransferase family 2 protein [Alphaproteobacteria bacterium]